MSFLGELLGADELDDDPELEELAFMLVAERWEAARPLASRLVGGRDGGGTPYRTSGRAEASDHVGRCVDALAQGDAVAAFFELTGMGILDAMDLEHPVEILLRRSLASRLYEAGEVVLAAAALGPAAWQDLLIELRIDESAVVDRVSERAIRHLEAQQAPGDALVQARLAWHLDLLGRDDEALAAARRAIEADPSLPDGPTMAAAILVRQGHPDEAMEILEIASERCRESADVAFALGELCENERDDLAAARSWYERALGIEPAHPDASEGLRRVLEALGDEAARVTHLEAMIAADLGDLRALRRELAEIHRARGAEAAAAAVERRARREQAVAEGSYERLLDPPADAASDRLWWALVLIGLALLVTVPLAC